MPELKNSMVPINISMGKSPDENHADFIYPFTGSWLPSIDPALIGFENFQTLTNMRYKKDGSGIEGINGYYDFNSTAITTYTTINTGIHFRTNRSDDSYLMVHAKDGSDNGRVLYSTSTIGGSEGVGSFNSTALHSDVSTGLTPRFSLGPGGVIAYANQEETKVWGGTEINVGSLFLMEPSSGATDQGYFVDNEANGWSFPVDKTDYIINRQTDSYFTFEATTRAAFLVLSTRTLQGINLYIAPGFENSNSANTNNIDVEVWSGTSFANVSNLVDGTSKMTQSGTLSFDSTESTAGLFHYEGRYLYAYLVEMSVSSGTSSCRIYQTTNDAPMQDITNVWDGVYRVPIQVQRFSNTNSTYDDYTVHVTGSSTVSTPVGLYLGQMGVNDYVTLMFEDRMSAFQFIMLGSLVNINNAQIDVTSGMRYWDGNSWVNLLFTDQTLDGSSDSSFSQTGLVYWNPPSDEEKTTLFGTTGYAYRIYVDATISGSAHNDVVADFVYGVPARKDVEVYKFPTLYKDKLMLCGYVEGNEGNRIDFSVDNAPDVFNGDASSMDGTQSIYVGSVEELTGAIQLYNRFGSNIYNILIVLKENETWLLTGDSPSEYRLFPISFNIGCPAYHTLTTAEVGFSLGEDVERNVAMWVSHQGPVMFDGAVLHPLKGIETYFDPNNSNAINFSAMDASQSWFDSVYQEWNLLIPTGVSTAPDTWLIYNIRLQKWYLKNVNGNNDILCGIPTVSSSGKRYIYGGSDDGRLYELEVGASWNGNAITYVFTTGDGFPSGNQWDITTLRRLKFIFKRIIGDTGSIDIFITSDTGSITGDVISFADVTAINSNSGTAGVAFQDVTAATADSGTAGMSWATGLSSISSISTDSGTNRLVKETYNINNVAWSHAVKFQYSSSTAEKGIEPIMWGCQYYIERKDT